MAGYEKVTLAVFKRKLAEGQYKNLTGARRAIGRLDWTDDEKKKAQAMANKHFGEPAPKQLTKKTPKAKADKPAPKKATKSTKAAAKAEKPAKAAKAGKPKKGGRPRGSRKQEESPSSDAARIQLANYKVGTVQQALTTMKQAKELGASEASIAQGARTAQEALVGIVQEVNNLTAGAPLSEEEQAKADLFKKAAPKGNSAPVAVPPPFVPQSQS